MRILMVADIPYWAFYNNAQYIAKYLKDYDINIICSQEINESVLKQYDHVHFMNWLDGVDYSFMISGGVSSHNFQYHHNNLFSQKASEYKALIATSRILYEIIKEKNNNVFCIQSGVDTDLFDYQEKNPSDKFVIGWVGQLNYNKIDIKGIDTILKPLIKRLERYPDIKFKLHTASAYENRIDIKEMPDIYKDMDCFICTSLREGAPNPVFEAASTGRAIVTTRVGSASEMMVHGENGFVIDSFEEGDSNSYSRTIDKFEEYILNLYHDRRLCTEMGKKSREIVVKDWTWEKKSQGYHNLFSLFR